MKIHTHTCSARLSPAIMAQRGVLYATCSHAARYAWHTYVRDMIDEATPQQLADAAQFCRMHAKQAEMLVRKLNPETLNIIVRVVD